MYSLEPPHRGGSNEYPQSMFWAEIWKISEFFIWKFSLLVVKFSVYLNRRVFIMIFGLKFEGWIYYFAVSKTAGWVANCRIWSFCCICYEATLFTQACLSYLRLLPYLLIIVRYHMRTTKARSNQYLLCLSMYPVVFKYSLSRQKSGGRSRGDSNGFVKYLPSYHSL